jgi:hypothetical protein
MAPRQSHRHTCSEGDNILRAFLDVDKDSAENGLNQSIPTNSRGQSTDFINETILAIVDRRSRSTRMNELPAPLDRSDPFA